MVQGVLTPVRLLSGRFLAWLGVLAIGVSLLLTRLRAYVHIDVAFLRIEFDRADLAFLLCAIFLISLVWRWASLGSLAGRLDLHRETLRLPRRRPASPLLRISCPKVRDLHFTRWFGARALLVGDGRRWPAIFTEVDLQPGVTLDSLRELIESRLRSDSSYVRTITTLTERESVSDDVSSRWPVATFALAVSLLLAFGLALALEEASKPLPLLELGANMPALVFRGDVDRLVTSNFLHGDLRHLSVNALELIFLGWLLEPVIGWRRLLLLGFAGGTLGNSALALADPDGHYVAYGASIWKNGLVGAFCALRVARPMYFTGIRSTFCVALPVVVMALLSPLPESLTWNAALGPDVIMHAVPVIACLLLAPRLVPKRWKDGGRSSTMLSAMAWCVVLVVVVSSAVAAVRLADGVGAQRTALLRSAAGGAASSSSQDELARAFAFASEATVEQLQLALAIAERAAGAPGSSAFIDDTVATLHHRLGAEGEAVMLEAALLPRITDEAQAQFAATQLVRFAWGRATSAPRIPDPVGVPVTVSVDRGRISFVQPGSSSSIDALHVYAVLLADGEPAGLVSARIYSGAPDPYIVDLSHLLPTGSLNAIPLYSTPLGPGGEEVESGWRYWPVDQEVLNLP